MDGLGGLARQKDQSASLPRRTCSTPGPSLCLLQLFFPFPDLYSMMTRFYGASIFTFFLAVLLAAPGSILAQSQTARWSYNGDIGPQHWANLSPDYAACNGNRQSPINLKDAKRERKPTLKIEYGSRRVLVVNRKRTTQVNTSGGRLTIRSKSYELEQFHVHTPAEHTLRGNRRAAEIHFVHREENGDQLAVLALLVQQGGRENAALRPLVEGIDAGRQKAISNYNLRSLFPEDWRSKYYRYSGSLTAPPCSENVRWVVLSNPIKASKKQLEALRARRKANNRPIQPRNGRKILRVSVSAN